MSVRKKIERHGAVEWLFWNNCRVTGFGALYEDKVVFDLSIEM